MESESCFRSLIVKQRLAIITLAEAVAQFQQEKLLAISFQLFARQDSVDR